MSKITDLTLLGQSGIAEGDLMLMRDVSANTDKKVAVESVIGRFIDHNTPRITPKDITAYFTDGSFYNRIKGTSGYAEQEDIYVGDYFSPTTLSGKKLFCTVDGSNGTEWFTVAGINSLAGNGDSGWLTTLTNKHAVIIPGKGDQAVWNTLGRAVMNTSNTTEGGYYGSYMNKTILGNDNDNFTGGSTVSPIDQGTSLTASQAYAVGDFFLYTSSSKTILYKVTVAVASGETLTIGTNCKIATVNEQIRYVFGSYLRTTREWLSDTVDTNASNNRLGGIEDGCSSAGAYYNCLTVLMSEVEVYGSVCFASSGYDIMHGNKQLPVFAGNNKLFLNNRKDNWWLKCVASSSRFCNVNYSGVASSSGAYSAGIGVRPRFVIGA